MTTGLEADHIICLGLGGLDVDDNMWPLCGPHHKIKTAADKKAIAKAKRLEARDLGTRRERQKIHSRPFPTTGRGFPKTAGRKIGKRHNPWSKR